MRIFILALYILPSSLFAFQISSADSAKLSRQGWAYFQHAEDSTKSDQDKVKLYQKALTIAKNIGEANLIEYCYGRIAKVKWHKAKYREALLNLDNAILYCNKHNKCKSYQWYPVKAYCYYNLNEYNTALKLLNIAEKKAIQDNDNKTLYSIYKEKQRICSKIDLLPFANRTIEKMVLLAKQIDVKSPFILPSKLADKLRRRGAYKEAIALYKQSIALIGKDIERNYRAGLLSYRFNLLGDCYYNLNDYDNAEESYKKAFLIADSVSSDYYSAIALLDLAKFYVTINRHSAAEAYVEKYNTLKMDSARIDLAKKKYIVLGRLFKAEANPDSALLYFKKALRLFEKQINTISIEQARSGFIHEETKYYSFINTIYKELIETEPNNYSHYDSLFKYSNIIRSRTLAEKKTRQNRENNTLYNESVESLKKYQRKLRLSQNIDDDEVAQELSGLKYKLLSNKLNQTSGRVNNINQISLQDFKDYLEQTATTAVIFNLDRKDPFVLCIDNTTQTIVDLDINVDDLTHTVNAFLQDGFFSRKHSANQFDTEKAYALYHDLWQPVEQQVPLNKNIIIIPDTPILSLPFDILLNKTAKKKKYNLDEQPLFVKNLLVNQYNFSILPSANLLESLEPIKNQDQALIICNPEFNAPSSASNTQNNNGNGWMFQPLLYSKSEAKAIKKILADATILEKREATFSKVSDAIRKSSIIHFATHAFSDTIFSMFSGLVLSLDEDSTDDGFLMGYDISDFKLSSDLVTLSACESGRGRALNNEGVMGLPRLFFAAGARSTLMNLWKVNDKFSAEFIPLFYNNLYNRHMSKSEALGQAKRMVIAKYNTSNPNGLYYNHPFYWASFNLYGDVKNNISENKDLNIFVYLIVLILLALTFFALKKPVKK